jgi:pyruvate dehydrogenase E1 component
MEECVDGEYQTFKAKDGAYTASTFFGKYPSCAVVPHERRGDLAADTRRPRSRKVYAAYKAAVDTRASRP